MFRLLSLIYSSIFIFMLRLLPLKKRIIITSTDNNAYNFNSSPLFEFLIKRGIPEWDITYVINDNNKLPKLASLSRHNAKFINTKKLSDFIYAARAKIWISSSLNTPITSFIYDKRRTVLHLGHGVPLKKIGLAEANISFYRKINRIILTKSFTDIICYSDYFKPIFSEIFNNENLNFHNLGQPRNDYLNNNKENEKKSLIINYKNISPQHKLLLYAPTWRPYAETLLFPFSSLTNEALQKFLVENKIIIFLRSHPFYPAKLHNDIQYSENLIDLNATILPDINKKLCVFDGLITDYSSIYFDFLCLKKPIYFIPYDLNKYNNLVGFTVNYEEFTPGKKIFNHEDFFSTLISSHNSYSDFSENILRTTNTKPSQNCEEIYNLLYKIAVTINNEQ